MSPIERPAACPPLRAGCPPAFRFAVRVSLAAVLLGVMYIVSTPPPTVFNDTTGVALLPAVVVASAEAVVEVVKVVEDAPVAAVVEVAVWMLVSNSWSH